MPDVLKPILARQMEVYAGFLEHVDHHVGRVIDAVADLGILDATLVFYIIGDNGASAEGQLNGTFNELLTFNGMAALETPEFLAAKIDALGGPEAYNHYAVGWAHAMDTPYQWTKQVASHWGGTRNGLVLHWPSGVRAAGEIRDQFHHLIDIAPTVLDVAGLPEPTFVHGVMQKPIEGVSMTYSFDDPAAPGRRETQYFEMMGNRGIYHKGWTACTKHRTPWLTAGMPPFDEDTWELYGPDDYTQAHDLAGANPGKLAELQRLWLIEATRHQVLPLDETLDIGSDIGTPVSYQYPPRGNEFTGKVRWVQIGRRRERRPPGPPRGPAADHHGPAIGTNVAACASFAHAATSHCKPSAPL